MNQATKLLLLAAILVLLAVMISKLQGPAPGGRRTASLRDAPRPPEHSLIQNRLSNQPRILRAKPESELQASPSPWRLEDESSPNAPPAGPLFPTGQTLGDAPWWTDGPSPQEPPPMTFEDDSAPGAARVVAWPPSTEEPSPWELQAVPPTSEWVAWVVTESQDSFWRISERVYGSGKYYRALYQHNRQAVLRPDRLEAGIRIATPPLDELRALYPQLCPDGAPLAEPPRGA